MINAVLVEIFCMYSHVSNVVSISLATKVCLMAIYTCQIFHLSLSILRNSLSNFIQRVVGKKERILAEDLKIFSDSLLPSGVQTLKVKSEELGLLINP